MQAGGKPYAPREWLLAALVAVVYFGAGWLGLRVASVAGAVTLFWAPSGIAIAARLLLGPLAIPAVFLASAALNFVVAGRLGFALTVASGNLLEALVAAGLFRLARGRLELGTPRDAFAFVFSSALGCVVASLVGAYAVATFLGTPDSAFLRAAMVWWLGDFAGAILVAPFFFAMVQPTAGAMVEPSLATDGSLLLLLAASVATWLVRFPDPPLAIPLTILMLAAITGASLRYGSRGGSAYALVIGVTSVIGTLRGSGPFAFGELSEGLALGWDGIVICAGTSLVVSALANQRLGAEERLRASEASLRGLFENAPDGMILIDHHRRIVLANPRFVDLSGMSLEQLLGADALSLLSEPSQELVAESSERGLAGGGRVREIVLDFPRTATDVRRLVIRIALLGSGARFEGAVVRVEDVTKREREAEERSLMEEQLAAAQRFDSIGNLAGGIAHDFNNMLQAITANLELGMLTASKGRDASGQLKRALQAAERASALTRQLLAFSRRQPASFERVDLVSLLRTSMAMLDRLLPEDIHLLFDPRQPAAVVRGDHAQLEQVVMNLVVNARDAMPSGGELRIELDVEPFQDSDGGLVRLVVTDQGPGVPQEIRDRIFEPFFTTKALGRGTGLGLAVVYGIVRSHGGSVRVEQAAGGGARFVVELPWLARPADATPARPSTESPEGHGERLLVVEDDALVRSAVRDMLESAGYEVVVASNGADAIGAFEDARGNFDLVLLDVVMPVMGGREAYERLRALAPELRVIFVTGYSEEQIDVGFVVRENVPVLTKPYDRASLLRAVDALLRRGATSETPVPERGVDGEA